MRMPLRTLALGLCAALLLVAMVPDLTLAQEKKPKKAIKTGHAAGIGALLGFALGGDPLWGAASGAALGAAGGMIANEATKGKRERKAAEEADRQQESADLAANQDRIAKLESELAEAELAREEAQNAIIEAVGPDVWEGYKSLRGCQHERAYALAGVGVVSQDPFHKLGAVWLQAMTAVDQKDRSKADGFFQTLVERDPEIDTIQQASLATDQAVLDMGAERTELGIGSCR